MRSFLSRLIHLPFMHPQILRKSLNSQGQTASERAVRLSPEIDIIAGADVVYSTEGRVAAPQWPGACDPAGVGEQGTLTGGFSRNLGGPAVFSVNPGRSDRVTNSRLVAGAPGGYESETRVQPGYRHAKATKRGGMGGWDSERPILPVTRGNRPEGPRRGKGAPGHETAGGTDARDSEP
jgi:hypothetical protein